MSADIEFWQGKQRWIDARAAALVRVRGMSDTNSRYSVTVKATDNIANASDSKTFSWTVNCMFISTANHQSAVTFFGERCEGDLSVR